MKRVFCLAAMALLAASLMAAPATAQDNYTRREDVIYGRKFGTALTMDVLTPKENVNGIGVVWVVSSGWVSNREGIQPLYMAEILKRGYTVFAVVHGSQPKYTVPECIADVNRAVRFVRYHAADYKVDESHLGIGGASAGGHLSLMVATAGTEGNPNSADPVERVSSRVQAVGCFFPPTDFLNYGKEGLKFIGLEPEHQFKASFDFRLQDPATQLFVPVDVATRESICKECSPANHVSPDDPPTIILQGDVDPLVPLQQAECMVSKLKEAGVDAELRVVKGGGHGWITMILDIRYIADWFDKYLRTSGNGTVTTAGASK